MQLSNHDRSRLTRFGCTLLPKENRIGIAWGPKPLSVAASANIFARLIHTEWATGPLLCLGFEISCSRALAQYCFLPFDLTNGEHARYISLLIKKGTIDLSFLGDSDEINRVYEVSARRCAGMAELLKRVLSNLRALPMQAYDFGKCVGDFEQKERLVNYFQYVVTDSELQRLSELSAEKAAAVASAERAQAAILANELVEVFQPRYDFIDREFLPKIPEIWQGLLFILDLKQHFQGDSGGLIEFLTNIIAADAPTKDYAQLQTAILLFKSLFRLMDDVRNAEQRGESAHALEADFRDVLGRIATGQGLSIKAVINLISSTGIQLGGQPGRHPRDYSREYDWKASLSWREVARKSLAENPEMRDEFSGRDFESLTFEHQESLKHRIREGVKSYAERTNKPFPIGKRESQEID
jgi:hypothetical protein